jgi:hypothetical protein
MQRKPLMNADDEHQKYRLQRKPKIVLGGRAALMI